MRSSVDNLGRLWASVEQLTASLTEGEWKHPTDCPGWSVQDHVSHLIDYESRALGRPGPEHAVGELAHLRNPMGQANEVGVDYRRSWPGSRVLDEFREVTAARLAQLEGLTDDDFAAEVQTPVGRGTLSDMLNLRVMDTWTHEQDIRRALGQPGNVDGPAADQAVRYYLGFMPYAVGKKAGAPEGSSVVVEIPGHVTTVEVVDGRGRAAELVPPEPTAVLRMDVPTFAALVSGRTTSPDGVEITGDADLGERVVTNMNVMV
jgi:uncharacterized protein (TIGR03083 family)